MSAAPVDFYFEFSSPYGYIASQLADGFEERIGRPLVWKPMLLGPVFKATGGAPLTAIPMKGDYSKRDFVRSARFHKVPFSMPDTFPINTVAACRAFYWVHDRDPAQAKALAKSLYRAFFADNRDISGAPAVVAIASSLGIDGDALATALEDPTLKDRTKREVEAAMTRGVFGSPFFVIDGEPFWGVDRMPMAEQWVRTGGW
jgi:2-hydroxychromene-2-carboxylate isomerase